jgi:Domain of Unknown Function (DUF1206)
MRRQSPPTMTSGSTPERLARAPGRPPGAAPGLSHRPELVWLARTGLVARGLVYAVIGGLALGLALGVGGKTASQRGALETIAHQPLGGFLVLVVAVGVAAYAVWRLVTAAGGGTAGSEDGVGERLAALAGGIAYLVICVTAVKILVGARTTGGASNPKHAAAGVLGWPAGPELVGAVGLVLVGVGLVQGYEGLARRFLDHDRTGEMSSAVKRGFTALGVAGYLARMVVFGLIGYGLIRAAIDYDPRHAVGLDGVLANLAHASDGPLALGIVAAGLIAFALYSIADARYRTV